MELNLPDTADIRNGVTIKEQPLVDFTIVNITQVIYAMVSKQQITILPTGATEPVTVGKEDALFNHYYNQLVDFKDATLAAKYK